MSHQVIVYQDTKEKFVNGQVVVTDYIAVMRVESSCGLTIEEIAAKDVPAGKAFTIIDIDLVPIDRTYRDAWELKDGKIVIDQTKADAIDAQLADTTQARQAVLDRLGITADEATALLAR